MHTVSHKWNLSRILTLVLLAVGAAVVLVPLLWTVSTSLKSPAEVFQDSFLPKVWKWEI